MGNMSNDFKATFSIDTREAIDNLKEVDKVVKKVQEVTNRPIKLEDDMDGYVSTLKEVVTFTDKQNKYLTHTLTTIKQITSEVQQTAKGFKENGDIVSQQHKTQLDVKNITGDIKRSLAEELKILKEVEHTEGASKVNKLNRVAVLQKERKEAEKIYEANRNNNASLKEMVWYTNGVANVKAQQKRIDTDIENKVTNALDAQKSLITLYNKASSAKGVELKQLQAQIPIAKRLYTYYSNRVDKIRGGTAIEKENIELLRRKEKVLNEAENSLNRHIDKINHENQLLEQQVALQTRLKAIDTRRATTAYNAQMAYSTAAANIAGTERFRYDSSTLAGKFFNTLQYGAIGKVQMEGYELMHEGVEAVTQFELGVVDLRRTLENVTEKELKQFGETALGYAKDFGQELKDTQDAMTELARAGVGADDLESMTKTVMIGLNTTEIETSEEMVGYLVSTIKQLGMEMSDSMVIIDTWNMLADRYAVHTDDFAKAIQKSGAASKNFGLDLYDVNAMVTILGEATQASGEQIGNALRSLEVRLLRPETISTLEGYGIAVKKDEEHFLSFQEIINNVSDAIADLDENSIMLSDIMDAMGGSWRKNWITTLANDWERFDELVAEQQENIGYSIEENEKAMDTLAKKATIVKQTFLETFVTASNESGTTEMMKSLLDGTASFLELATDSGFVTFFGEIAAAAVATELLIKAMGKLGGIDLNFARAIGGSNKFLSMDAVANQMVGNIGVGAETSDLNVIHEQLALAEAVDKKYKTSSATMVEYRKNIAETKEELRNLFQQQNELVARKGAIEQERNAGLTNLQIMELENINKELTGVNEKINQQQQHLDSNIDAMNGYADGVAKSEKEMRKLRSSMLRAQIAATALNAALSIGIGLLITGFAKAIDKFTVSTGELEDSVENLGSEISSIKGELEDLNKELDNVRGGGVSSYGAGISQSQAIKALEDEIRYREKILEVKEKDYKLEMKQLASRAQSEWGYRNANMYAINALQEYNKAKEVFFANPVDESAKQDFEEASDLLFTVYSEIKEFAEADALTNIGQKAYETIMKEINVLSLLGEGYEDIADVMRYLRMMDDATKNGYDENYLYAYNKLKEIYAATSSSNPEEGDPEEYLGTPTGTGSAIERTYDAQARIDLIKREAEQWRELSEVMGDRVSLAEDMYSENNALQERNDLLYTEIRLIEALVTENEQYSGLIETLAKEQDYSLSTVLGWVDSTGDFTQAYYDELNKYVGATDDASKNAHEGIRNLGSAIQDITSSIRNNKKEITDISNAWISEAYEEMYALVEAEYENKTEALQKQYESDIEDLANSIYGMDADDYEYLYEQELTHLQDKLEALEEINSEKELELEREEKLKAIEEARLRLQNALENKNTVVLKKQADGTYQNEYVADPSAVQDAQQELEDLEAEYANWLEDQEQKAIQSEIDALQKQYEMKQREYNRQLRMIDRSLEDQTEEVDEAYEDIETVVRSRMEELTKAYNNQWDKILRYVQLAKDEVDNGGSYDDYEDDDSDSSSSEQLYHGYTRSQVENQKNYLRSLLENGTAGEKAWAKKLLDAREYFDDGNIFPFAKGGVADYTGLAFMHGSSSASEVVFNASDAKKLYDLVHNMPISVPQFDNSFAWNLGGQESNAQPIVTIDHIEFPNATDRDEIREALLSLPRVALQW